MKQVLIVIAIIVGIAIVFYVGTWLWRKLVDQNLNLHSNLSTVVVAPILNDDERPIDISGTTTVAHQFNVTATDFAFLPTEIRAREGEVIRVLFRNEEGIHDLVFEGYDIHTRRLQEGEEEIIQFVADTVGTFTYYCSVDQHRARGMEGTLIVVSMGNIQEQQ